MDQIDAATFNNLFVRSSTRPRVSRRPPRPVAHSSASASASSRSLVAILPPEYVTKADCQRSVNHDTLVKICDIEPQSSAAAVNFRGKTHERYIEGDRYEIPFFKIESDKFRKNEARAPRLRLPGHEGDRGELGQGHPEGRGREVHRVHRRGHRGQRQEHRAGGAGPATSENLVKLFKALDTDELSVGTILMHKADWLDFMTQEGAVIGSPLASEILVNGYKYNTILGHKLVVTIKSSIVPLARSTSSRIPCTSETSSS
jgi:hypothetical protein